jgi:putative SOS response-associated peptidase YedK
MCGRAAQSLSVVQAAAESFHVLDVNNIIPTTTTTNENGAVTGTAKATATATSQHNHRPPPSTSISISTTTTSASSKVTPSKSNIPTRNNTPTEIEYDIDIDNAIDDDHDDVQFDRTEYVSRDNYNMSPGMDAIVFWMNHSTNQIQMKRMVWGILPRNGTMNVPLVKGMGKHFTSLMFNARADTLYEKVTFTNLSKQKQSCIIAMDGFYEWKTEMGRKQPYFVYRNRNDTNNNNNDTTKHPYLLMAGLWKTVATGWEDQPIIDTFTIITTEVCEPLKWLHSRMPVVIWNKHLAMEWLQQPSIILHSQLVQEAQQTKINQFQWHPVTPAMSSMKFRSMDATKPIPKQKTVKSFFTKSTTSTSNGTNQNTAKKQSNNVSESPSSAKKTNVVSMSMNSNTSSNEGSSEMSSSVSTTIKETTTTNNDKKRKAAIIVSTTIPTKPSSKSKKQNPKIASSSPSSSSNHRKINSFFTPKSTSK